MTRKILLSVIAVAALVIVPIGAATAKHGTAKKSTLTIGATAPLTGPYAQAYGAPYINGVILAVRQINAHGGINGHKLAVDVEDHKGDPGTAALVMQKFASRHVPVVISNMTGVVSAQGPIATAKHMLLLNAGGSDPHIALTSPYTYTTRPYASRQYIPQVQYMKQKGVHKIAIVSTDSTVGHYTDGVLRSLMKKNGIDVVGSTEFYNAATTVNFSAIIARVRAEKPDAVYIYPTGNDAGNFVKQAVAAGLRVPMWSSDAFTVPSVVEAAGSSAWPYIIATSPVVWDPVNNAREKKFVSQWKKSFPNVDVGALSAIHYDTTKCILVPVIKYALAHGGYNGPSLIKAIRKVKKFTGCVTGETVLAHGRDMIKNMQLIGLDENGNIKQLKLITVAAQTKKS